jgi:hypothetical protein
MRISSLRLACLSLLVASLAFPAFAGPSPSPRPARVVFTRYVDRTEGAFLLLVPRGWKTRGGMVRMNALSAGGAGNATDAKIDFTVSREGGEVIYTDEKSWDPNLDPNLHLSGYKRSRVK